MELVASGLRQGFAFSTTVTCRYFSLRFVPGTNGKLIRVELSVPPGMICPCGGYRNWKRYVLLVKTSHSPTGIVGVAVQVGVAVDPPGVRLGVGELPVSTGVAVGVFGSGDCVNVGKGVSTGAVGDAPGVGVDVLARIFRLPGIKSIAVRTLSPLETRALHSTDV